MSQPCNETRTVGGTFYVCIGDNNHEKGKHYYVADVPPSNYPLLVGIMNGLILSAMFVLLTFIVCYWVFR